MSSTTTTTADPHLQNLLQIVHNNLQNQADWSHLRIETHSSSSSPAAVPLPRPLITGLPPEPVYSDQDQDQDQDRDSDQREWVLPVDLREKWSLRKWAAVFDALPSGFWGEGRGKRCLLAAVAEDSTVVYYIVNEGVVKPRQN